MDQYASEFDRSSSNEDAATLARLVIDEFEERIIADALGAKIDGTKAPARVVTCATRPYAMLRANDAFFQEFGLEADSSLGSSLKIIHAAATNTNVYESCLAQAGQNADGESCLVVVQLAEGKSATMQMDVKPINSGKDLERRMMMISFTSAGTLRKLEEVQADLSKGARAIVKLCSPQHITYVNQEWCAQLESDRKQFVGRSLKGLNGPATDQRVVHRLMKTVSRCMSAEATFVAYCLSGTMKLVNLRCFPLQCEAGNIDHFCADAVTCSIMSLGSVLKGTSEDPMVAISTDKKKIILHANAAFRALIDVAEGQSLSDFLNEALDGENLNAAIEDTISCASARKPNKPLLITLFDKDKKPVVAKVTLVPLVDAKFNLSHIKLSLMPVDVLSFSAACAKSDDGRPKVIAMVGTEGTIKYANAEWCSMYGLESSEVLGRGLSLIQGPSSNPKALQEVMDKVNSGKTHEITTVTYHRDGTGFLTTMQATPVLSDSGRLEMFLCVVQDVTAEQRTAPEYPITPTGHITHINGYTQLVLYPKADPTLERCIDYLEHLRDASIVKGWKWDGDALRVNVDTRRVLKYTQKSEWCRAWTSNLRTWHAWWNRMLWVVSETSRRQQADEVAHASDLDFLGGSFQTMPALDDLFSPDFRQISDDNSPTSSNDTSESGSSPRNEAHSSDDTEAESADRHSSATRSGARCNAPPRLQQSVEYEVLGRLDETLGRQGMQSSVCVIDRSGRLLYVHEMLSKMIGFSRRQTLGLCWSFLAGPDANRAEVKRLQQAFELGGKGNTAGTQLSAIVQLRRCSGEAFCARIVARPTTLDCMGEAVDCFCTSLEDCSEVMDDAEEASLTLEGDTYAFIASMELQEAQEAALDVLQAAMKALSSSNTQVQLKDEAHVDGKLKVEGKAHRTDSTAQDPSRRRLPEATEAPRAPVTAQQKTAEQDNVKAVMDAKDAEIAELRAALARKSEEHEALKREVEVERTVTAAAVSALQHCLPSAKREPLAPPPVAAAPRTAPTPSSSSNASARPPLAKTPASAPVAGSKTRAVDTPAASAPANTKEAAGGGEEALRFVEEFGGLSVEAQRQYLRQMEAAHLFLHEQLGLEQASAWTPAVIAAFEERVLAKGQLQSGLCLCDAAGAIVWCNESFQRHTGFSGADVTGCQWMSFLCGPDTDADDIAMLQKSIDAHQPGAACLYAYHEDGRPLWLQVGLQPVELRLPGKEAANCFVLCLDIVTLIMERILASAHSAVDDVAAVRAANEVSRRQKHALVVGAAACEALGASATWPAPAAMGAPARGHAAKWAGGTPQEHSRRKSVTAPYAAPHRKASPRPVRSGSSTQRSSLKQRGVYEVLLSPGKDASELLLSGLLWDLRARGLVRRWAWDSDGTLRLAIYVGVVWPKGSEEGAHLLVDSQGDTLGWKGWLTRLAAAAKQQRPAPAPAPQPTQRKVKVEAASRPGVVKGPREGVAAPPVKVKVEGIAEEPLRKDVRVVPVKEERKVRPGLAAVSRGGL